MIKNILWDFDGVILDSMKIKGDGFRELFSNANKESLDLMEEYHYTHGGVSRFDKIRYFHNIILSKKILEDEVVALADKFANIIEKKLFDQDNLIMDSINFIDTHYQKYNFHIVSGAEHNELNKICNFFNLSRYFISIEGSPVKKDVLVKKLLENYEYRGNETILIGDALSDYDASLKNGIKFYGYNNIELNSFSYISSFKEFKI